MAAASRAVGAAEAREAGAEPGARGNQRTEPGALLDLPVWAHRWSNLDKPLQTIQHMVSFKGIPGFVPNTLGPAKRRDVLRLFKMQMALDG